MMEIKKDLGSHRTYLWIIVGLLIGIALVMAAIKFLGVKNPAYTNNKNIINNTATINGQEVQKLPQALDENGAPVDQLKDIDPTKPYVDDSGVVHPPLGGGIPPAQPEPTPIEVAPEIAPAI